MTDLLPTHTCFDDAVANMAILLNQNGIQVKDEIRIVHAIIAPYGKPLAHAWVTFRGRAYFSGVMPGGWRAGVSMETERYERGMKVVEATRYTIDEAVAEELEKGIGPWKPEYRALCNAPKEKADERQTDGR
ncbi:MAG: hypothetical protein UMS36scaffold28_68 [Phage 59_13]|nr:MAG: hypothetical protein UMS36scaffold28_68 [Phage 59_13]